MKKALLLLATMFLAACGSGGGEGTQTGTLKLNMTESTAKTVELSVTAPQPDATYARLVIANPTITGFKPIITDILAGSIGGQIFQLPVSGGYTIDVISYYQTGTGANAKNRLRKHGSNTFTIAVNQNTTVDVPMSNLDPQLAFNTYSTTKSQFIPLRNANARVYASSTQPSSPTTFDSNHRAFYNISTIHGGNHTGYVTPLRNSYGFAWRTTAAYQNMSTYATTENNTNAALYKKVPSPATNIKPTTLYGRGEFYLKGDYLTDSEKSGTNYKKWVYAYPYTNDPLFQVPVQVNGVTLNPSTPL